MGEHPHRGFETVTFAVEGEVEHRDSGGGGGKITTGGVQWMTAGSGVVHEEFHSRDFALRGGTFEMLQLWVNLPAKEKMTQPRYQSLEPGQFPLIDLGRGKANLKLIAGEFSGTFGPAKTFTKINIYEISFKELASVELDLAENTNTLVFQIKGQGQINDRELEEGTLAILEREGEKIQIDGDAGSRYLVLNGEPIDEPVSSYGPFVMNTEEEIRKAIKDYQAGQMGSLVNETESN